MAEQIDTARTMTSAVALVGAGWRLSPIERRMNRLMRAPDGHEGGDPPADPAAPADPLAAPSLASGGATDPATDPAKPEGGDPKPAEPEKKEGEAEAPKGPPEAYELKTADGVTFDKDGFGIMEPVLREIGLDNDQAQKLVDIAPKYAEHVLTQAAAAQNAKVLEDRANWARETQADAEIGGANLEKSQAMAAKAIDRFAGDEKFNVTLDGKPQAMTLRQYFDLTGLGNSLPMMKLLARVGAQISEDGFARGTGASAKPKSLGETFFNRSGTAG